MTQPARRAAVVHLPGQMYGGPRQSSAVALVDATTGSPVLEGQLVTPGETTAEDVAKAWLMAYADNENTARSYARAAGEWFEFCRLHDIDPLQAKRPLVELFKNALYDRGKAASTVNQRLSSLSSFYTYAEDQEACRRSPLRGVRRAKLSDQSSSTGLTREELSAFLAGAQKRGTQMHALMTLLALNGLRASEPLLCNVEDLGTERGHRTLTVTRKGQAQRVRVPLAPLTARLLDLWLEERAQLLLQTGKGSGLLFFKISRNRGREGGGHPVPLDRRDLHSYVRSIGRKTVPEKTTLHPHDLRHAFVTLSLDAGVPLRDVQDSAGHASPSTTRRYDQNRNKADRHATYTLAAYLGIDDD